MRSFLLRFLNLSSSQFTYSLLKSALAGSPFFRSFPTYMNFFQNIFLLSSPNMIPSLRSNLMIRIFDIVATKVTT